MLIDIIISTKLLFRTFCPIEQQPVQYNSGYSRSCNCFDFISFFIDIATVFCVLMKFIYCQITKNPPLHAQRRITALFFYQFGLTISRPPLCPEFGRPDASKSL